MHSKGKIKTLIVDDEIELRRSVTSILCTSMPDVNFEIVEAENGKLALDLVLRNDFDLVIMDVKMPEMSGLEALARIKEHDPSTLVVIMTAHANTGDAVLAIKEGAFDYLEKPIHPERLTEIVRQSFTARELVSDLAISNPIFDDDVESEFVGQSQKMREVFNLIYRLCKVDTTVLIRGENGTGKELVAKAIHYNSPRKGNAFVAINCGAIPESLMESEFFGHEKGAFTGAIERKIGKFQLANNGTLFLDEVGELKPEMQVKLLRVLQEKKFVPVGGQREVKTNARIIAATNRNLEKMIEESTFREDLFYRLNVMPIFMPPLRERIDDLDSLVQHFIKKFNKNHPSQIESISQEALDAMRKYRWPGNIRELENSIERAFIMESGTKINVQSLPENIQKLGTDVQAGASARGSLQAAGYGQVNSQPGNQPGSQLNYESFKEQAEKDFIIQALKANKGRINQTVARANIPKNTLLRKIKKYGIVVADYLEKD